MSAGWTPACPASSVRIGPAAKIAMTVEPISTPAARAASPPAMAVVATEAISHGASPAVMTPSRSGPAGTTRETAHDSAGSTLIPTARAASSGRQAAARRRSAAGSIVTAVAKTRMASKTLMPWRAVSQANGGWTVRPMTAATSTAVSSGKPATSRRSRITKITWPIVPA